MQKILIFSGVIIATIGFIYPYLKELGVGQLPGDIILKAGNSTFYFPIVSCITISLFLTIIFNFFRS